MYWLFLDDLRDLSTYPCCDDYAHMDHSKVKIARNTREARKIIKEFGMPSFMALDHDLGRDNGNDDTTMMFLRLLASEYDFSVTKPPGYAVHSANPVGTMNIHAFMKSWKDIYNPE